MSNSLNFLLSNRHSRHTIPANFCHVTLTLWKFAQFLHRLHRLFLSENPLVVTNDIYTLKQIKINVFVQSVLDVNFKFK